MSWLGISSPSPLWLGPAQGILSELDTRFKMIHTEQKAEQGRDKIKEVFSNDRKNYE